MLRWSWRDLRRRWVLVVLTAIIISIGTGTYAGLGGTTAWRVRSLDQSYETLRYHDLRVRLPTNVDVPAGRLASGIRSIDDAAQLEVVAEQLIVPSQIDASVPGRAILVPGEIVGLPAGGEVDQLHIVDGRAAKAGTSEVVLEAKFVEARNLSPTGRLRVSGGAAVRSTGSGITPAYFQVLGSSAQVTGAYGFAVVFAPLDTAQSLTGKVGRVNDAVIRLAPGADEQAVARQIEQALGDVGATIDGPALYGHLSATENLRVHALLTGTSGERVAAVLRQVGLDGLPHQRVSTFSTGMKGRLALAIALLTDPPVVILDEPQNGLDPDGIIQLRTMIRSLAAEGRTVLVSSHQLAEVTQFADDVGILANGALVFEATTGSLTDNLEAVYLDAVQRGVA